MHFFSDLMMFGQFKSISLLKGITENFNGDGFLYCSVYDRTVQLLAERKVEVAVTRKSNVTEIFED